MQLSSYTAAQWHHIEHSTLHEQTELGGLLLQPLPTATAANSSSTGSSRSSSSSNSELTLLAQGDGFYSSGAHSKALQCYQQQLQGKMITTCCTVFNSRVSCVGVTVLGICSVRTAQ
jgi:hypothetical protein